MIVISGDEEYAVLGPDARQRADLVRQLLHASIDEIAGDHDQVCAESVRPRGNTGRKGPSKERTDVHVGQLRDPKAVQLARPVGERELDTTNSRDPKRARDGDRRVYTRQSQDGESAKIGDRLVVGASTPQGQEPQSEIADRQHGDQNEADAQP